MSLQADQAAKDALIEQARQAYRDDTLVELENGKTRPKTYDESYKQWLKLWQVCDFSWEGLADTGWDRLENTNYAQELKQWKAPATLPIDTPVYHRGVSPFKEASLQDYWRYTQLSDGSWRDEFEIYKSLGLLKERNGHWHFAIFDEAFQLELPDMKDPSSGNGTKPEKDIRSEFINKVANFNNVHTEQDASNYMALLIYQRLETASQFNALGFDGRSQMVGSRAKGVDHVWQTYFQESRSDEIAGQINVRMSLAELPKVHADNLSFGKNTAFDSSIFGEMAGFMDTRLAENADFFRALFDKNANFEGAILGEGAFFHRVHFGDHADFKKAVIKEGAEFRHAQFGKRTSFLESKFDGWASFQGAQFDKEVTFHKTQFGDEANFASAQFGDLANFNNTQFGKRAYFGSAQFGEQVSFISVQFEEGTYFNDAKFEEGASFESTQFGDRASFRGTQFDDEVCFRGTQFGWRTNFEGSRFGKNANFNNTQFGEQAYFGSAQFGEQVSFISVQFEEGTYFNGAHFVKGASFAGADFKGSVSFENTKWASNVHYESSFVGARFRDIADFRISNFLNFSIFDGADFQRKLLLSEPSGSETPKSLFKRALRAAKIAVDADEGDKKEAKNKVYGELSGGYRTTKAAMEREGDFERAQRYYRFEVQTRLQKASVNWPDKLAAAFYAFFSDYGASIGRPLASLALSTILFALVYLLLGVGLGKSDIYLPKFEKDITFIANLAHEETWQALEFSMNNAFRPLSALIVEEPSKEAFLHHASENPSVSERLLFNENGLVRFGVKMLSIMQSFLSILLAFLFGLAVRRKFQIS